MLSHPNASLAVGTAERPFSHGATILLDGSLDPSREGLSSFSGGLVVQAGRLELHGPPEEPTWTHLAQMASVGDTSIVLSQPVNWAVRKPLVPSSMLPPYLLPHPVSHSAGSPLLTGAVCVYQKP